LKPPPERDITVEGLASYGNYRIFAATTNSHIYDGGIEYDRHSWHRFLGARMDYVGEVLPVVILRQPTNVDIYGITVNQTKKTVYGFDISPIGFRWMWFDKHTIKPYVMAKGGIIAFSQKVPTSKSTYENMTLQSAMGLQVRMSPRYDLRLGLFGDFHFSNGFITPVNPGLDVMNAQIGLTYHVGPGRSRSYDSSCTIQSERRQLRRQPLAREIAAELFYNREQCAFHPKCKGSANIFRPIVDEQRLFGPGAQFLERVAIDLRVRLDDVKLVAEDQNVKPRKPAQFVLHGCVHGIAHIGENGSEQPALLERQLPVEHRSIFGEPHARIPFDQVGDLRFRWFETGLLGDFAPERLACEFARVVVEPVGPVELLKPLVR
jgi:hypothetical protein